MVTLQKKIAVHKAEELAKKYPDDLVFISFFRALDQQHGYVNRNGVGFTGKTWTAVE